MKHPLMIAGLILAGCSGAIPLSASQGTRIDIEGDVFAITATDTTATARNYATGLNNQARLIEHAAQAIATATGCTVDTIIQRPMLNTYDATLSCAA